MIRPFMIAFAAVATALLLTAPLSAVAMSPATDDEPAAVQDADYLKAEELIDEERYGEAVALLETVIERDPDNADAWSQLGFASRKLKGWEKSEMYYAKALALDPQHEEAMEYMGELYLETGRPALAETMLAKLVKLCPDGCEARSELEEAIAEHKRASAKK